MPSIQDLSLKGAATSSTGGPSSTRPSSLQLQSPLPSIAVVDKEQQQQQQQQQQHHHQNALEWTAGQGHGLDNSIPPPPNYPYSQWNRPADPRTSSTQSLAPSTPTGSYRDPRRTLLVIYIHGFMGNDSSFRSFPAHVHNYLRQALAETHIIHSKIYPRYKTYKSITVARDNFSNWLLPHESPTTDVILIGHSMGGLLAAEVALLPRQPQDPPAYDDSPFRHRILGTLSLDAPLLGLHPGIVVSGIASLFRKAPSPPGATNAAQESHTLFAQQSPGLSPDASIYSEICPPPEATSPIPRPTPLSTTSSPSAPDPFFNPKFFNDVSFVDRGWLKNIAHFAQKHSQENLVEAATNHIISHLEFGGCLADYPGMKSRYNRLRRLEDVDELNQSPMNNEHLVRVRFVNYYTISTGILKNKEPRKGSTPKVASEVAAPEDGPSKSKRLEKASEHRESFDTARSQTSTPRSSTEEDWELTELEPVPEPDDGPIHGRVEAEDKPPAYVSHEELDKSAEHSISNTSGSGNGNVTEPSIKTTSLPLPDLPPIPDTPSPPPAIDLSSISGKDARKQAEKDAKQARKEYEAAVKNRDKILKERLKIVEKHEKAQAKLARDVQKELEKLRKNAEKQEKKDEKEWGRKQKKEEKLKADSTASRIGELETHHLAHNQSLDGGSLSASLGTPAGESSSGSSGNVTGKNKSKKKDKGKKPKGGEEEKQKLRKFCMLPSKINGIMDPTWIQVYMEGVDEVGAHCGLFFAGPHYDKLVGDVSSRIMGWVQDDASKRLLLEGMQGLDLD
ncbi:hypothetical protein QR685DRAFT_448971 [Neurospora intermedia]|uniref:DUF676 domain-containing protein n=1 Tax=Neurospora intermedia TaxID=5142 RepID=A0ABR3D4X8_NEUIN